MFTLNMRRPPAWRELYELQTITALLFLGFVPIVGYVVNDLGSVALVPAASVYGGTLLFAQRRTIDWKCPRCGNAFLRRKHNGIALLFRTRCGNCQLLRGASFCETYSAWEE